ncbi:DUF3124 domain-containing protein [Croceivirga sp. JEA036]|uniref:DUF3124 domain-containing protein n=1 Tax=Croceivirga sp. JEA036 TaxID=2721162 RepID=UPI00143BC19E|nr:DUF3124 domain-containing protein [Croceivirga sp. JEA036]NJB35731.1 DUF3124 domain-containing protein [Croceivirga sp. JEA036]
MIKLRYTALIVSIVLGFASCNLPPKEQNPQRTDFSGKPAAKIPVDSLVEKGQTYLSVYSGVYSYSEHSTHNLTSTISLRNRDAKNEVFITKATYFDTQGTALHEYIKNPISLKPMETLHIVIDERDESGGTGANFIFDWAINNEGTPPLFEAVMISTQGQQGLSFVTTGERIK